MAMVAIQATRTNLSTMYLTTRQVVITLMVIHTKQPITPITQPVAAITSLTQRVAAITPIIQPVTAITPITQLVVAITCHLHPIRTKTQTLRNTNHEMRGALAI